MAGRRSAWLAGTAVVAAGVFAVYAFGVFRTPLTAGLLAFATGIGAYGWVGIFFVMSAEIGGPKDADSYVARWSAFAVLAGSVAVATLLAGPAIDHEARR
jgi:hypothetical protein